MRKLLGLVSFLSIACINTNTSHSAQYWAKTYGMDGDDRAYYVQLTSDGGYMVAGYITEGASKKTILLKLNSYGSVVWQKNLEALDFFFEQLPQPGRNLHIRPLSLQKASGSGYIIAYGTVSFGAGGSDMLVQKVNNNGDIIWQKTYGGTGDDYAYSLQETADGGYIIAGKSGGIFNGKLALIRVDSSGNISWQKGYEGSGLGLLPQSVIETPDGGYIVAGNYCFCFSGDCHYFWVMKVDGSGTVSWIKECGHAFTRLNSMQPTSDGGCIVLSDYTVYGGEIYIWMLKFSSDGNMDWQRFYGPAMGSPCAFQETPDGGYIIGVSSYLHDNTLVLSLNSGGEIVWQKIYDGSGGEETISHLLQTADGGYIVAGNTASFGAGGGDMFIVKLEGGGEISYCDIITAGAITPSYFDNNPTAYSVSIEPLSLADDNPSSVPQNASVETVTICCYGAEDFDCDGVRDGEDNCPHMPNGLEEGTCTAGSIGSPCLKNEDCGVEGLCSMNQDDKDGDEAGDVCDNCPDGYNPEQQDFDNDRKGDVCDKCTDTDGDEYGNPGYPYNSCPLDNCPAISNPDQDDSYPPQGNAIGDACECEGNFNCSADQDVDGSDVAQFKMDFGRNLFNNPCINESQCHGDFNCDHDCDGTDAALFKQDFGRSPFNNPCPACVAGAQWCNY